MRRPGGSELEMVIAVLAAHDFPFPARHARRVRALLRRGGGEEEIVALLEDVGAAPRTGRRSVARDLLRIGVAPGGGRRRRRGGRHRCTICEEETAFCWGCGCGFRICQGCLEENRWGLTCNNITWECPDCGRMRSF